MLRLLELAQGWIYIIFCLKKSPLLVRSWGCRDLIEDKELFDIVETFVCDSLVRGIVIGSHISITVNLKIVSRKDVSFEGRENGNEHSRRGQMAVLKVCWAETSAISYVNFKLVWKRRTQHASVLKKTVLETRRKKRLLVIGRNTGLTDKPSSKMGSNTSHLLS